MASSAATIDHILDTVRLPLSRRKMFGEYALYLDEKVVALVCDDTLFIKPTATSLSLLPDAEQAPAYPGGKNWIVGAETLDDPDLCARVLRGVAADLPPPKPKKPKKPRAQAKPK
jgi:TfoX/Sxy family transcriptional regulator of competence genes